MPTRFDRAGFHVDRVSLRWKVTQRHTIRAHVSIDEGRGSQLPPLREDCRWGTAGPVMCVGVCGWVGEGAAHPKELLSLLNAG